MSIEIVQVKKQLITGAANTAARQIMPFKGQIYDNLRMECLQNKRLFEDPQFLPIDSSIFYTQRVPVGTRWKRPHEIVAKPVFIDGTASVYGIVQGNLGDCWFLAGCTSVVLHPQLFENVVPAGQTFDAPDYAGIFCFNFWYYGHWVNVVIDDKLPVDRMGRLMFCCNNRKPNEFWSALLEKAYAKLVGNYQNLNGGSTTDALVDMTGGIQESMDMKYFEAYGRQNDLWELIMRTRKYKSLIGASINPDPRIREARLPNGLVMGHAYTITKIAILNINSREERIVRLRHPWGNEVEWNGAWSDKSNEWNQLYNSTRTALEHSTIPDGESWMRFVDFVHHFDSIQFCHFTPDSLSGELMNRHAINKAPNLTWKCTVYHDEWKPGVSSGGCGRGNMLKYWTNPQFLVTLVDRESSGASNQAIVIISLAQKYSRQKRTLNRGAPAEQYIQFRVYKIISEQDARDAKTMARRLYANQLEYVADSGPYIDAREVTLRLAVVPGNYLIIPSCYEADTSCEFLLRLFTEDLIDEESAAILKNHKENLCAQDIMLDKAKVPELSMQRVCVKKSRSNSLPLPLAGPR